LRSPGPGGASKRSIFPMNGQIKALRPPKVKETRPKPAVFAPRMATQPLAESRLLGPIGAMKINHRPKTYAGPVSDHFDGMRFYDPDGVPPKSLSEVLRWQFGRGRKRAIWPDW